MTVLLTVTVLTVTVTVLLQWLVQMAHMVDGIKKVMEIALLGDRFSAQEAKDIGMINFVVPSAELEAETASLAQRLAAGPTHVYGNTKALFYRSLESEFESQLQAEAEYFADCASRADFREGVTAFVEKRSPNFTGS